ncbi:MAG: NAD(P)-dependent oxidoreductase [Betaproteobacteria bacterium]
MALTIAFAGLGMMGRPMAGHLARAGFSLRVADASHAMLDAFCTEHPTAVRCANVAEAARGADILVTMLPNGAIVREVALAAGLQSGQMLLDMSSSAPMGTRALGEELAKRGIEMVDAPVSGGVSKAKDATLAIMAGGRPEPVERARPVLEKLGAKIILTGPLGSGHAMKALNNYVSAAGLAAAAEALLVARAFGLDPAVMTDVLNASSGRNNSTESKLKQHILSGKFASGFAIDLMAKDLATAGDLARALNVPVPLAEETIALWKDAATSLPGADHTAIFSFLDSLKK